jgi:hypothetical protein
MSVPTDAETAVNGAQLPWYVYDRHANLLHVASTWAKAEAWAFTHWAVVEVADREEVAAHDYFYLLLAEPAESGFHSRDFQARIMRQDRVVAIGRDSQATPRYPV